jgi:hypothetical protein
MCIVQPFHGPEQKLGAGIMLYNIAEDPEERTDLSADQPAKVKELLARMAFYGRSKDQVPPVLFWPKAPTGHGIRPWNYQCPQCPHSDALVDAHGRRHWDPWCDNVTCGVGPPAPPRAALPAVAAETAVGGGPDFSDWYGMKVDEGGAL